MKWFRLYAEIKDDPKMLELDDAQFRVWINLLAMASEADERGIIPAHRPRGLAAALHTTVEAMAECFTLFAELSMVEQREDGTIIISNFMDRQYDSPSDRPEKVAERKQRHRERQQNTPAETRNDKGTTLEREKNDTERLYSDTDSETENTQKIQEPEGERGADAPRARVAPIPKVVKVPLPTETEAAQYFTEKGRPELADGFWDYWQSIGWKRGGAIISDWKATVRTWIAREDNRPTVPARASPSQPSRNGVNIADSRAATLAAITGGRP